MERRTFIRWLTAAGTTATALGGLAGCSSALPPEALAAWHAIPDGNDLRRWVLAHALLAPHSHNLQSWRVDLRQPDRILLACDLNRTLPETDPFSRQMMMSQGTFIELLALAAAQRGVRAEVTLFPEGEPGPVLDGRPTALIRLQPDASVRPDPLFHQIPHRRTNREAYAPERPGPVALAAIATAATAAAGMQAATAGACLSDSAEIETHRQIARDAWRIELETPRTILESYRWLRIGPSEIAEHRDGISLNKPLVRLLTAAGLFDRTQAPQPGDSAIRGQIDEFNARIAATPAFWWLSTADNRRPTQVNAGRAYVRAQLAATAHGLSMQPLSQALQEYPEQARLYADVHRLLGATGPGQTVQMWARLGSGPAVQPAPRRGLDALLT